MTMHVSELTMGRVVEVFYDDGLVVTGMVKELHGNAAYIDIIESNNPSFVGVNLAIQGNSCHCRVEGKNGWYLPS